MLPFHEACEIFPVDEENIDALANDIKANGLIHPVEVMDGKIVDGRRRSLACERIGIQPHYKEINVADPVSYVVSLNLQRRHLTPSQAAICASKARNLIERYEREAKERQKRKPNSVKENFPEQPDKGMEKPVKENFPEREKGQTRDKIGEMFGISGRMVDHGKKVVERAIPEVVRAVEEGKISVMKAVVIMDEPPEVQMKAIENPETVKTKQKKEIDDPKGKESSYKGNAIFQAYEAINALKKISISDKKRLEGYDIVSRWIKTNS